MLKKQDTSATENFHKLIHFCQAAYKGLGTAKDTLFELSDVVMAMPAVQSFAELSCSRRFRRGWPSLYEALQDGRPDCSILDMHRHRVVNARLDHLRLIICSQMHIFI